MKNVVTVVLSTLEAKGLCQIAGNGADLLRDKSGASDYVGGKLAVLAAWRGLRKLAEARPGPAPLYLTAAERAALREACGSYDAGPTDMTKRQRAAFDSAWRKL